MYAKRGGVAAYHVVCIGLCLRSVRVCVFLLVLWTTNTIKIVIVLNLNVLGVFALLELIY